MVHDERVRSDAARNARAIIDAARAVVAEQGIGAPMSAIAARAGVAVGTLYRHHPTKQDLVGAVVADTVHRMADLCEGALARARDGADPGEELAALLRAVASVHVSDRAFKESAGALDEASLADPAPGSDTARALAAVEALLALARGAGSVRPEVEVGDLLVLLTGAPADPARLETYLAVVVAGLRPSPGGP